MARDRLRDPGLIERQRTQARIASDIGIGGRVKVGNVGGGGGGFAALTPPAIGLGNRIEHVTLLAEASQTIASGGAGVSWDRIASAPTEVRGFASLVDDLADTGAVVAIPVDVTGVMMFTLSGKWADNYKGSGQITVRRDRVAGTPESRTYDLGDVAARTFDGTAFNWEVKATDTITVTLPNGSGSSQTLEEATIEVEVKEVAAPTSTLTSGYRALILSQGPIAYWRFGEAVGSGTAVDETGNGNDVAYNNVTLEEPGLLVGDSDTAVRVAEVNSSYIGDVSNTDLAFAGTQPYTMTTLMNVDVLTIGRTVVNWRTAASTVGWRVSVTPAGEVVFERHDGASSDQISGSYTTSTTHHVAVTYDGATMRLYVDGAQVASTASTRSQPGTGVLRIARLDLEGLDGVLDEMALWDQELSAAQIAKQNSVARGSS